MCKRFALSSECWQGERIYCYNTVSRVFEYCSVLLRPYSTLKQDAFLNNVSNEKIEITLPKFMQRKLKPRFLPVCL